MRQALPSRSSGFLVLALLAVACGAAAPADDTARPAGTGWFCHGALHAAFCARTIVECDALRVDTALDPGAHPCDAHPQANCFTYRHPTLGEHWRCFDTAEHCAARNGQCTNEESCSACAVWD